MKGRGIKGVGKEIKRDGGIKGSSRGEKVFILLPVDLGPFDRFGWSVLGSFQVWAMASPGWSPVRPFNFLKGYRFFFLLVLRG